MRQTILAICLAIPVAAFSQRLEDGLLKLPARAKIVVLGSSTAAGSGASKSDNAWVNKYNAYLKGLNPNYEVINLAVGGYTTYHLMPDGFSPPKGMPTPVPGNNITKAISIGAQTIIINISGGNDIAAHVTFEEVKENYAIMIAEAQKAGIPVWVSTAKPRDMGKDAYRLIEFTDWILEKFGNRALDTWTGLAEKSGAALQQYEASDHVHLNDAGHEVLFKRMVEKTGDLLNEIEKGLKNSAITKLPEH